MLSYIQKYVREVRIRLVQN